MTDEKSTPNAHDGGVDHHARGERKPRPPHDERPTAKIEYMTAKELLLQQAPSWTEHDAEIALRAVEHEHRQEGMAGDIVDEWGDLSAMTRTSTARAMRRLDEEEAAAGFSWEQYRPS
jgi:hypothetical protein